MITGTMGHESPNTSGVEEVEQTKADLGEHGEDTERADTEPNEPTAEDSATYENSPEVRAYLQRKQEYEETITQWNTHIKTALTGDEATLDHDDLEASIDTRERMKKELIEVSANYPGDWTSLLYRRMIDPVSKEKFVARREEAMVAMKTGEVGRYDKPKQFQDHYQNQIDTYDETIETVFNYTKVNNERPQVLGSSAGIGDPGTVYTGAHHKDKTPLTPRQKNIIEAHEKGHSLRDFESPLDSSEIRSVIDELHLDDLTQEKRTAGDSSYTSNYVRNPAEIIERMAQFKNYFGMGADETFTKKHLDHIRTHYTADTGLDNGITYLLRCVTPETEVTFLSVINKYPI